jgi:TRAP-type mannitol/chloroaromatic compound transport system permease small subunit
MAPLLILITCYVVITRYIFNTGSIAVQESVLYVNALLVFFTAGFTLKHNAHVRVDIIYGPASVTYKAWVNLLGAILLLLPVAIFIFLSCWDYVVSSWAIREDSPEANGLPFVYLLKTTILAMCVILVIQAMTEVLRGLHFFLDPASAAVEMEEEEDLGTL